MEFALCMGALYPGWLLLERLPFRLLGVRAASVEKRRELSIATEALYGLLLHRRDDEDSEFRISSRKLVFSGAGLTSYNTTNI